jgi:hypothetical protein
LLLSSSWQADPAKIGGRIALNMDNVERITKKGYRVDGIVGRLPQAPQVNTHPISRVTESARLE